METGSVRNITDLPDEILTEIILNLNARERAPLGNTCKRFYTLVFEDEKLLRDLDFSTKGRSTLDSNIHQYFSNKRTPELVLKLNLHNVYCIRGFDLISKAINLVDLNVQGTPLTNLIDLENVVRPLVHMKRLSFDWVKPSQYPNATASKTLHNLLSKLTYLSVKLLTDGFLQLFYQFLQSCQELRELRISIQRNGLMFDRAVGVVCKQLKNLEIVEYYGPRGSGVEGYFISTLLPQPEEWTHFHLAYPRSSTDGFYLERNLRVCPEMRKATQLDRHTYNYPEFSSKLGGFVVSACILKEVMQIIVEDLPYRVSCLSEFENEDGGQIGQPSVSHASKLWMLKIPEAKRLLEDPRYKISYLSISRNIDEECDAHIVVSAFPSLTELVLSNITKRKINDTPETYKQQSSFHKLVNGTPNMRRLTVLASDSELTEHETWDLSALHLISGWRSLTSLCLWRVPIKDVKFLMDIGKQCKNLEKLELYGLGSTSTTNNKKEWLQMLIHCSNLRHFTLEKDCSVGELSEVFTFLSYNLQLETVCIQTNGRKEVVDLRPSLKRMLYHCSKLTTLGLSINGLAHKESDELTLILESLKSELNRPTLQFQFQIGLGGDLGMMFSRNFPAVPLSRRW